jgi:hypothetical protein
MRNFDQLRLLVAETLIDIAIMLAPDTPAGRRLVDRLRAVLAEHFVMGVAESET